MDKDRSKTVDMKELIALLCTDSKPHKVDNADGELFKVCAYTPHALRSAPPPPPHLRWCSPAAYGVHIF